MKDSRIHEGLWRVAGFALFAGVAAASPCQSLSTSEPHRFNEEVSLELSPVESAPASCVREILDRSNGNRWILQHNRTGSAGPGRMILITSSASPIASGSREKVPSPKRRGVAWPTPAPIIRAGERLIVEEHTAMVEASLEAIALGQATTGAVLVVRLKVGGKTVKAIARAPGRAVILHGLEISR
jgi:hypothetical protein